MSLATLGDRSLLDRPKLAVFCSSRCPGSLILEAYDIFQGFRERRQPVISGFHSPVEKHCLTVLLRSECSLVVCPARGLKTFRVPVAWQKPMSDGRLAVVSPFPESVRRNNRELAAKRNEFVAGLAQKVVIVHAATGSKLLDLAGKLVSSGKPVFTIACDDNRLLLAVGVKEFVP